MLKELATVTLVAGLAFSGVAAFGAGVRSKYAQGVQVVGQYFGSHISDNGLLGQARDVLKIEPVLEPFESLLNFSPFMGEVAKAKGRKAYLVEQIGHQNAHVAIGGDVPDQTHGLWNA